MSKILFARFCNELESTWFEEEKSLFHLKLEIVISTCVSERKRIKYTKWRKHFGVLWFRWMFSRWIEL